MFRILLKKMSQAKITRILHFQENQAYTMLGSKNIG